MPGCNRRVVNIDPATVPRDDRASVASLLLLTLAALRGSHHRRHAGPSREAQGAVRLLRRGGAARDGRPAAGLGRDARRAAGADGAVRRRVGARDHLSLGAARADAGHLQLGQRSTGWSTAAAHHGIAVLAQRHADAAVGVVAAETPEFWRRYPPRDPQLSPLHDRQLVSATGPAARFWAENPSVPQGARPPLADLERADARPGIWATRPLGARLHEAAQGRLPGDPQGRSTARTVVAGSFVAVGRLQPVGAACATSTAPARSATSTRSPSTRSRTTDSSVAGTIDQMLEIVKRVRDGDAQATATAASRSSSPS